MPTPDDHAHALHTLLPDGPIWDGEDLYLWLRALGWEPSRIDAAAERHVTNFHPATLATHGEYIDDWARVLALPQAFESDAWDGYTDAQKAAVIQTQLRGRGDPTLAAMQTLAEVLFSDAGVVVTHRLPPSFLCGQGACGSPIGEAWQGAYTVRYMANGLNASPDDFASWDTIGAVTNNAAQSPATLGLTADRCTTTLFGGLNGMACTINGTADGDQVRGVVWARAADSVLHGKNIQLYLRQRDGISHVTGGRPVSKLSQFRWEKLIVQDSVGSGSSSPALRIGTSIAGDLMLSYAMAGVRTIALETRMDQLGQLHTTGSYQIKGEDAT